MKMPIVVSICVSAFLITGALTVFGQSGSNDGCQDGYVGCNTGGPRGECIPAAEYGSQCWNYNARGGSGNPNVSNDTQGERPCLTPATAKTASECKSADGMWHVECGKGTCKSKVSTSSGSSVGAGSGGKSGGQKNRACIPFKDGDPCKEATADIEKKCYDLHWKDKKRVDDKYGNDIRHTGSTECLFGNDVWKKCRDKSCGTDLSL